MTDVKPLVEVVVYTCETCGYEIYHDVSAKRDFLPLSRFLERGVFFVFVLSSAHVFLSFFLAFQTRKRLVFFFWWLVFRQVFPSLRL